MGRMELVQKIVAENPHLVRHDVESIVDTVVRELRGNGSNGTAEATEIPMSAAEPLHQFLELTANASDEELNQPLDRLDPALVRDVFEAAFASLAWSAATLRDMVRENERFQAEFDRRAREISEQNAANEERIRHLIAS